MCCGGPTTDLCPGLERHLSVATPGGEREKQQVQTEAFERHLFGIAQKGYTHIIASPSCSLPVASARAGLKTMGFRHAGRRRRADIFPIRGLAGYFLHRIRNRAGQRVIRRVQPSSRDPDRSPFLVEYEVRRKLRGRGGGWGKALHLGC